MRIPHLFRAPASPSRLVVTLLSLLYWLIPVAPAQAAWAGKDGAIAFMRSHNGKYDIWLAQSSGEQRRLTAGPKSLNLSPNFSPNGQTIAYTRYSHWGDDGDIWLMNADGTDKRPLTRSEKSESEPHFFPGGRRLVFTVSDPPPVSDSGPLSIFSMRIDGSGLRRLAVHAKEPVISQDGRWLAYIRYGAGNGFVLEDLGSGERRRLPNAWGGLDFSPDSTQLLFTAQRSCGARNLRLALLTIGVRDRHPRVLLRTCGKQFVPGRGAWSPSGHRIVFNRLENLGTTPSGEGLAMVSVDGALIPGAPQRLPGKFGYDPAWQPLPSSPQHVPQSR